MIRRAPRPPAAKSIGARGVKKVILLQIVVTTPRLCPALVLLAPNSRDPDLSADVMFVSLLAMVFSQS